MILPLLAACMAGRAARMQRNGPWTLMLNSSSQDLGLMVEISPCGCTAALVIRMSIRPQWSSTLATMASTDSMSPTLQTTGRASPPAAFTSSAV